MKKKVVEIKLESIYVSFHKIADLLDKYDIKLARQMRLTLAKRRVDGELLLELLRNLYLGCEKLSSTDLVRFLDELKKNGKLSKILKDIRSYLGMNKSKHKVYTITY